MRQGGSKLLPYVSSPGSRANAAELVCTATHSTGLNIDYLIETGGLFPVGTAEFECVAFDGCGAGATCSWTVTISPANLFNVTVQFSPSMVPGPLNRCIEFIPKLHDQFADQESPAAA